MLSPAGAADRHGAVQAVYRIASEQGDVANSDLRLGGPTIESVALDTESQRSRIKLAGIAVLVASALAWWCLRDLRLVGVVFGCGILAATSALAAVFYSGGSPSILMISMPTLIYVLTVSAGIHLVNYFKDGKPQQSMERAIHYAVNTAATPCTLTVATTALGLGSLAISQVLPVRNFGTYAAIGVLISLPVVLLVLPAAIYAFAICPRLVVAQSIAYKPHRRFEHLLRRSHRWLVGGCVAVMLLSTSGLVRLDSSVHLLNLFDPHSRILSDYSWLEAKLGPLVPVEIVLTIPHDHPSTLVDRLQLVSKVEKRVQQFEDVGSTMSAATWTPEIPTGRGLRQLTQRKIVQKELTKNRDNLIGTRYLNDTADGELWRISASGGDDASRLRAVDRQYPKSHCASDRYPDRRR